MTSNLNAKREVSGSASSYNWLARQFHWFIAALIFYSVCFRFDDGGAGAF